MTRLATTLVLSAVLAGCTAAASPDSEEQSANLSQARSPIALSGDYRFADSVRPLGRLTVDVIDTRMSDAQSRLEALRSAGASCSLVISNTYRCTKMHPAASVPSESLGEIAEDNQSVFVTFGAVTGSPSVVTEGDSLTEWEISQEGTSSAGPFTSYRYLELADGLVKIILPGSSALSSLELIVEDEGRLGKWSSTRTSEGRWRWHEDMGIAALKR